MAKYKQYSYTQGKFIALYFEDQILPGTFEYTLNYLIDNEFDLSIFDARYKNDETGAPAYDPRVLLKIILYAYSRGIVHSRKIARCCKDNVIFMALSADSRPHFTTIAEFVSTLDKEIVGLFLEVLLVCDRMGLIGKEMFAIDGCKLPSNASKEWSGTRSDFEKKKAKLEKAIERMVERHRQQDRMEVNEEMAAREQRYIKTLQGQVKKIRDWLQDNEDKPGSRGAVRKSNITDNDSAKMKSAHGVIQGYDGVAVVDGKHQVIVHGEAFGEAQEHGLLEPMVEGTRRNFKAIDAAEDIFEDTKLTTDSGFHTENNMQMLFEQEIDAYVADKLFRKRDPRFAEADRYKKRARKERAIRSGRRRLYRTEDFVFDESMRYCLCPAGKRLYRNGGNVVIRGFRAIKFRGPKRQCRACEQRPQCLRHPDRTEARQVAFFLGRCERAPETFTEKMKRKVDTAWGRFVYSKRIGTVEPAFANISFIKGLDRFTLRGKRKVNGQWLLYCIVHNLTKVHRFGPELA